MAVIGQSVDDGDRAVLCQILDFFLIERAYHNTVKIAREHARSILHGLTPPDLQIPVAQKQSISAELVHSDFERNAGAGRGLLKDHAEFFAFEITVKNPVLPFVFELIGKVKNG